MNENEIIPQNEDEADQLLEQIEQPSHEPIVEAKPEAQDPQFPDEYAFTVGGKEVKGKWTSDRDKVIKWAQMGYEAPTKIGSLTKEIESWKQKGTHFEALEKKYGEIDKYVREKPDFWDHVQKTYQQRNQALQDQSNPLAATVSEMQKQVQELVAYKSEVEQRQQHAQAARDDQAYQADFEGIKKQYPKIDFATPGDDGKSLEYKVLEYANENGIKSFKTAFRDFYHDELLKFSAEEAKEKVAKDKFKNTKLGLLGRTDKPTKQMSSDVRGKSYDDLVAEALQEHGIA